MRDKPLLDRRRLLASVGATVVAVGPAGAGIANQPVAPDATPQPLAPIPPDAPPGVVRPAAPARRAPPSAAWLNFEFAIAWERVNVLQEIVTGLIGRGVTDLTLLISSNGGDLSAAISTYHFLTSAGVKLTTYNVGNVYSAGVILYLAGERRVADVATQFVIHPPALNAAAASATLDDLHVKTEALDHEVARMRELILSRTRMAAAELDPMLLKPAFISPQKALGYGLATEVGHIVRPPASLLVTMPVPGRPATPTP